MGREERLDRSANIVPTSCLSRAGWAGRGRWNGEKVALSQLSLAFLPGD